MSVKPFPVHIDKGDTLFFRNAKRKVKTAPPSFKKVKKYKSFTLKQAGYKLYADNRIKIENRVYRFHKSREIQGAIKTVTIKRDSLGDMYIGIVCQMPANEVLLRTGKSVGYDFGLKTFLTASDDHDVLSSEFFKQDQKRIAKLNRELSRKHKGSNHYRQAKRRLARAHKRLVDRRRDFHFKLSAHIAGEYATICIEDLNIKAMQRLWGRTISDLSFRYFVQALEYQCTKTGSTVVKIPRFFPSSKTCSDCGCINDTLTLKDRTWVCHECDTVHDRDRNAAHNIHRVGASTLGLETVRPV